MAERYLGNRQENDLPKKGKSVLRKRALLSLGAVPLAVVLATGCSSSGHSLPDIGKVPAASQLPAASSRTESDYSQASQAVFDAEVAGVGDTSQVDADLSQIKNKTIATFATAAVDYTEGDIALNEATDDGFGDDDPQTVVNFVKRIRVVSIRNLVRRGLDNALASHAIVDAGNFGLSAMPGQPTNEQAANADLRLISNTALRRGARIGVKLALADNPDAAYNIASIFGKTASTVEGEIVSDEGQFDRVLDKRAA